jgi:hypothetical protein
MEANGPLRRDTLSGVESRKNWRNREPSAGEGVVALLEALREGLGAVSVGLFDDDRSDPERGESPPNFWEAFEDRPCARIDWDAWYRELRRGERVQTACGCGSEHHLCGYLIHDRWALLVVAPPALHAGGAAAIASSLRALAEKLPPGKTRAPGPSTTATTTTQEPQETVMWWVRKDPQ